MMPAKSFVKSSVESSEPATSARIKLKVLPATSASPSTLSESAATAKELTEQIIHVHVHATSSSCTSGLLIAHCLLATHVVGASLVGVHEGFVCCCNFLEFLFGSFGVVLVFVGVVFDG